MYMKYDDENLPKDWEIAAILPVYTATGDCTKIVLCDGRVTILPLRLKAVLQMLARLHCKTLPLLRAWGAKQTGIKNGTPLAIDPELVLLPFRVREPRVAGDNTMGCVNMACIEQVEIHEADADAQTVICLPGGRRIRVCWHQETMRHHWRAAKLVEGVVQGRAKDSVVRRIG